MEPVRDGNRVLDPARPNVSAASLCRGDQLLRKPRRAAHSRQSVKPQPPGISYNLDTSSRCAGSSTIAARTFSA
jgi:hypothetical protein